jgi:hypothetical protein
MAEVAVAQCPKFKLRFAATALAIYVAVRNSNAGQAKKNPPGNESRAGWGG